METYTDDQQRLARIAKALGHPVRVYIMDFLSKQSCCYSGDLSELLPIAKSTLSQHLIRFLHAACVIEGDFETRKIRYCLNKEKWEEAKSLFKGFLK